MHDLSRRDALRLAATCVALTATESVTTRQGQAAGRQARGNAAKKLGGDEVAIRAVLQRAVDAWGKGDGSAYGAVFEEDADYVTFGGMHVKGRRNIASQHQHLFDGPLKGTRLKVQVTSLRFLRPDITLLHAVGGILDAPGQKEVTPERSSIQMMVLRKRGGQWRMASNQVTRIQSVMPGVNVPQSEQRPEE
jgi:uncharacterized protein (TIGR02246 family)